MQDSVEFDYRPQTALAMAPAVLAQQLTVPAGLARRARPARRAVAARCGGAAPTEVPSSRRAVLAALVCAPALVAAVPAFALIEADDDDECAHVF